MTKKELSQLFWLNKEIGELQKELRNLETSFYSSPFINWEIKDLKGLIALKLKQVQKQRYKLEQFIDGIEDSQVRLIFRLRHVNGLYWEQIGNEIGYSKDGVRKRYLREMRRLASQ